MWSIPDQINWSSEHGFVQLWMCNLVSVRSTNKTRPSEWKWSEWSSVSTYEKSCLLSAKAMIAIAELNLPYRLAKIYRVVPVCFLRSSCLPTNWTQRRTKLWLLDRRSFARVPFALWPFSNYSLAIVWPWIWSSCTWWAQWSMIRIGKIAHTESSRRCLWVWQGDKLTVE